MGVGSGVSGMCFDGKYLWVSSANPTNIFKINVTTGAVVLTLPLSGDIAAGDCIFSGRYVYAIAWNSTGRYTRIAKIDVDRNVVIGHVALGTSLQKFTHLCCMGNFIAAYCTGSTTIPFKNAEVHFFLDV